MNTQIKNLDLNKILAVDIETVRGFEHFDEKHEYYDTWAWKQRDRKTNEIPEAKDVIDSYYNEAALSAEWGKIVCISVAYIHNGKIICKSFTGDEKGILKQFVQTVKKTGRTMALHNARFDVPYIRKRYFINGLPLEDFYSHNDISCKPWEVEKFIFDTMEIYKGIGFNNTSLDELAMAFNVPSPKGDMHGNEVGEYYYSGRITELTKYCEGDCATVLNIILRWRGEDILEWESKTEIEVKHEGNLLHQLNFTKNLDNGAKEQLKKILSKNKITKKEKEIIFDLVKASLAEIDIHFGKVKNQAQVDEIINRLKQEIESN